MRRLARLGIGVLIALIPARAFAYQASLHRQVRGVVVDAESGTALAGVRVAARAGSVRTETGGDGRFTIAATPGDTLVIRAGGYRAGFHVVAPGDTLLRISLTSAPIMLADLVVTASRRTQRAGESAVAVTRISTAEIESAAAASLDGIIATVPGLAILPNPPTGANLAVRGIDGARVLVLIDGEPTLGALLENRDLSRISTVAADHIEIVKGPLSALYGSDALGGVINVITRDPAGPLSLEGRAHFGSLGRRDAQLTAQAGGPFSFRISGGWREQGQVASAMWADDALSRVWDVRATGRVVATPTLAIRTDVNLLRERQRWRVSSDGFNGFNDNTGATGWTELRWQQGNHTLRSRVYFERYEHLFRQARSSRPLAIDTTPAQTEWMAKATASWSGLLGGHTWDGGLDLSHRAIESPGKVAGTAADDMVEGYLQAGFTLGELLITPAARLSWNSRWGEALTPSLAAAWNASDRLRLRGGVGRGYRGPSFKELLWDFPNPTAGYLLSGNPDLRPERSWQVSGGATWAVGGGVSLDGEVYHNNLRDLIELGDFGFDPPSGLIRYAARNVARAFTQGFEVGLRWTRPTTDLSVGYNYLDSEDRATGDPLARRARHSGRARGAWNTPDNRIGVATTLVLTGQSSFQQLDGTRAQQGAFVSVDAQGRIDLAERLGVVLGVDNVLDQRPTNWVGIYGRRMYAGLRAGWRP